MSSLVIIIFPLLALVLVSAKINHRPLGSMNNFSQLNEFKHKDRGAKHKQGEQVRHIRTERQNTSKVGRSYREEKKDIQQLA